MEQKFRYLGKFTLTRTLLEDAEYEALTELFKDLVVLRTTEMLWEDKVEYLAISKHFEFTPEGEFVREYTATFFEDSSSVVWRRI